MAFGHEYERRIGAMRRSVPAFSFSAKAGFVLRSTARPRQIFRWIQAQVALIETCMVQAAEVFYPYLQVSAEHTVYERAIAGGFGQAAGITSRR